MKWERKSSTSWITANCTTHLADKFKIIKFAYPVLTIWMFWDGNKFEGIALVRDQLRMQCSQDKE